MQYIKQMQNNNEMLENPYYKKLKDLSKTATGKPEKEHYEIMMKTLAN